MEMHRLVRAALVLGIVMPAGAGAQELPPLPDPVPVTVERGTTALLVLDMNDSTCATRPSCVDTVPAVAALLSRARAAGLAVLHSTTASATAWVPELTPQAGEPTVTSGADKFLNTDLDEQLRVRGINTVLIVGTFGNGAVLYTAYGASARGYTVVLADDGISSPTPFATYVAEWQLLNGPGTANPENAALRPRAVTLSRSDRIEFE
jgi:nicotinamidase-related amidase